MDFAVTLEKKEMEVIAWMLKTRTKTHIIEACKGLVLGLIVLAVEIYNIFYYEESTAAQVDDFSSRMFRENSAFLSENDQL